MLTKNQKIYKTENKISKANLVQLLWKEERVEESRGRIPSPSQTLKCSVFFIFERRKKEKQRSVQTHHSCAEDLTSYFLEGDEFKLSREVLKSRRKQLLVEYGKGTQSQATLELSETEDDSFFD